MMEEEFDFKEFRKVIQPAVDWLHENGDPHKSIIIEYDRARLVGDLAGVPVKVPV